MAKRFKCDVCGKTFETDQGLKVHSYRMHTAKGKKHKVRPWNKGQSGGKAVAKTKKKRKYTKRKNKPIDIQSVRDARGSVIPIPAVILLDTDTRTFSLDVIGQVR